AEQKGFVKVTTASALARHANAAPSQTTQTRKLATRHASTAGSPSAALRATWFRLRRPRATWFRLRRQPASGRAPWATWLPPQAEPGSRRAPWATWLPPQAEPGLLCAGRAASRVVLVVGNRRVVEVGIRDGHALHRLGEQHVLRVDEVVAVVLGDLEVVAERDRVERAGELAVAAEDAARHVDLVDARVALARRDAVLRRVFRRDDADAVSRARRGAERAPDALLEPVLVPVQPVPAAVARIDRPLVLRVLLRDRLAEDLLQRHAETLQRVRDDEAHTATTSAAVTSAFTVATGSSTFQPN